MLVESLQTKMFRNLATRWVRLNGQSEWHYWVENSIKVSKKKL